MFKIFYFFYLFGQGNTIRDGTYISVEDSGFWKVISIHTSYNVCDKYSRPLQLLDYRLKS